MRIAAEPCKIFSEWDAGALTLRETVRSGGVRIIGNNDDPSTWTGRAPVPLSDLAAETPDVVLTEPTQELLLWVLAAGTATLASQHTVVRLGPASVCWFAPRVPVVCRKASEDIHGWSMRVGPAQFTGLTPPSGLDGLLTTTDPLAVPVVSRLASAELRWSFERLAELATLPDSSELDAGLAYVAIRVWRCGATGHDPRPGASQTVLKALRLLDVLPDGQPWTATALAREVGLSPGHLARQVRIETGRSLTDHRQQRQLDRYLDFSDDAHGLSISDAAYAAGFGSYAQFHRIFVQRMGCSPSEHRTRRREAGHLPS